MEPQVKWLNKYYICMFIVVLISIVFKLLFIKYPFHGLEYEDAYIFSDVARYLQYNYKWAIDPFQTKSCMDGSLTNCYKFGTFGGHYMIFPYVVFLVNACFGYSLYNIFVVNFVASIFVLYVYVKILNLLDVSKFGIIFSSVLLVTTPFLNIFNTSGLSETFSSLCLMGTIYYFIKCSKEDFDFRKSNLWLAITLIILSFLIKRENLILLCLPVLASILLAKDKKLKINMLLRLLFFFVVPLCAAIAYNSIARVSEMEAAESLGLGVSTFNLINFFQLFPKYLSSFFNIDYFGITGALFIVTSIYVILLCKKFEFKLIALLSFMYLIMYSSHYRSYYQVHFGNVSIFETLRYSTNYFPIACICFGALTKAHSKIELMLSVNKNKMVMIIVGYISIVTFINITTRLDLNNKEFKNRIHPVTETLKITNDEDWILSDMTSVFHLYADEKRNFIDCYATKLSRVLQLKNSIKGQVYLLRRENDNSNIERYPEYFYMLSKLNYIKVKRIAPNYELIKLVK